MDVHIWGCVLVFQVINVISTHHGKRYMKDPLKETGDIFASVIKNITRVNNELQQLIHKYEAMQKTYAVPDSSGSDTPSTESDYESEEEIVNKKRSIDNNKAVTGFTATQIIWSDEAEVKPNISSYEDLGSSSREGGNSNGTENIPDNMITTKTSSETEIIFVDTTEITQEIKTDPTIPPTTVPVNPTTPTSKTRIKEGINEKETEESSTEEEDQKTDETTEQEPEDTDESDSLPVANKNLYLHELRSHSNKGKKHRGNKHKNKDMIPFMERKPLVAKKLYSETFSAKKIWDEIINNKPIKLEIIRKKMLNNTRRGGKTAIIIITNNQTKDDVDRTDDLSEVMDTVKEEAQAAVLRHDDGDACFELVVRKCYKAMKAVIKSICNRFKCKNSYREKFLEFSKTGCIAQFFGNKTKDEENDKNKNSKKPEGGENGKNNGKKDNKDKNNDDDDFFYRVTEQALDNDEKNSFVDSTREGYLNACLPHIETEISEMDNKEPGRTLAKNFNILRDRFERACKEISISKCKEAGKYARTQICESYPCSSAKKRAFDKTCRAQCKMVYQRRYGGRSSDSSDSDSGSDSDSDSDSDSYSSS